MESEIAHPPVSKKAKWGGWALTAVVVLMLLFSAGLKLAGLEEVRQEFDRLGYPESTLVGIGVTEVACAVLYAIPQTSYLGAILVTGYLGGATATHVRVGDPYVPPVVVGVIAWVGLFLRDPRIRRMIPLNR
jgi:hypothetical protein